MVVRIWDMCCSTPCMVMVASRTRVRQHVCSAMDAYRVRNDALLRWASLRFTFAKKLHKLLPQATCWSPAARPLGRYSDTRVAILLELCRAKIFPCQEGWKGFRVSSDGKLIC
jgi:hypothetical protein